MNRTKRNLGFDERRLEEEGDAGLFEEDDFTIHYSNQTYFSSPRARKFKVGKKEFLSEMLFGRGSRKKTRVTRRLPN
jgi:hypothetical protein